MIWIFHISWDEPKNICRQLFGDLRRSWKASQLCSFWHDGEEKADAAPAGAHSLCRKDNKLLSLCESLLESCPNATRLQKNSRKNCQIIGRVSFSPLSIFWKPESPLSPFHCLLPFTSFHLLAGIFLEPEHKPVGFHAMQWMPCVASELNWKLPAGSVKTNLKGTAWLDGNHSFVKSHPHFLLQDAWCTCYLLLNFFWKGKKKKKSLPTMLKGSEGEGIIRT